MSLKSDKCENCANIGYEKGRDDYDHIHCRMCWSDGGYGRNEPAEGETWSVWCQTSRANVEVKALKIRPTPAQFKAPVHMFRDQCQMIQVDVGRDAERRTFLIHEPLLVTSSAYFQRALKTTFVEGMNSKVELEEEDPQIFGLLNEYLYTGRVRTMSDSPPEVVERRWIHFSNLWLLAHYLQMPKLVNYAMHQIFKGMDATDGFADLPTPVMEVYDIYERAPMESKLRKLLVDRLVWSGWSGLATPDAPSQLLWDMVVELMRKCNEKVTSPLDDSSNYYMKEEELVTFEEVEATVEEEVVTFEEVEATVEEVVTFEEVDNTVGEEQVTFVEVDSTVGDEPAKEEELAVDGNGTVEESIEERSASWDSSTRRTKKKVRDRNRKKLKSSSTVGLESESE